MKNNLLSIVMQPIHSVTDDDAAAAAAASSFPLLIIKCQYIRIGGGGALFCPWALGLDLASVPGLVSRVLVFPRNPQAGTLSLGRAEMADVVSPVSRVSPITLGLSSRAPGLGRMKPLHCV